MTRQRVAFLAVVVIFTCCLLIRVAFHRFIPSAGQPKAAPNCAWPPARPGRLQFKKIGGFNITLCIRKAEGIERPLEDGASLTADDLVSSIEAIKQGLPVDIVS